MSLALFTLNFLNLDNDGLSAADRHFSHQNKEKGHVKWKDILTGTWHGPDPVLAWVRGSVCMFPQDHQDPVWIPERLIRKCNRNENRSPDPQQPLDAGIDGAEMGDPIGVPKTHANMS